MYVLIVEHCSANTEVMGSNPFEVTNVFLEGYFAFALIAITTATIISSFKYVYQ